MKEHIINFVFCPKVFDFSPKFIQKDFGGTNILMAWGTLSRATKRFINESIDRAEIKFADGLNTLSLEETTMKNQVILQEIHLIKM